MFVRNFLFYNVIISLLCGCFSLSAQSKKESPNPSSSSGFHSFVISWEEIEIKDGLIYLEPGRNVKSSTYKTYIYSEEDFKMVYGSTQDVFSGGEKRTVYCSEKKKETKIQKASNPMMQEPDGGYRINNIHCKFRLEDLYKLHAEFFGNDPEPNEFGIVQLFTGVKWISVNKKGEILHEIFLYDNGPDYLVEGLYRFVRDGLMGYANREGKEIIPAKYEFADPFENGQAKVCNGGCKKKYDGEHYTIVGGTWKAIDKSGKFINSEKSKK